MGLTLPNPELPSILAEVSWGLYTEDELPGCCVVRFQGDVDVGEGIGDAAAHRGWLAPRHRNHTPGAVGVVPGSTLSTPEGGQQQEDPEYPGSEESGC